MKKIIKVVIIILVAIILSVIIVHINNVNQEMQHIKQVNEDHAKLMLKHAIYYAKMSDRAEKEYFNNFSTNLIIQQSLNTILSLHSYLDKSVDQLKIYINMLQDNITIENYDMAYQQYLLCQKMNNIYSENYIIYFAIFDEHYEELFSYLIDNWRHESVLFVPVDSQSRDYDDYYVFAIRDDLDSDHNDGIEVRWFTEEIQFYYNQLEIIKNIIGEIK